jgi:uncharacterized ferritin-like protein (DUF455 family)
MKDWSPFSVISGMSWETRAEAPRALHTREGVGDRLRAAAFAEIQAREAFLWAFDFFVDAPADLRRAWKDLARAEDKHLGWLLKRMGELGIDATERQVSDHLWLSLKTCKTAEEFAIYMANAEERGRKAGERFHLGLLQIDPVSAEIFGKIAEEELAHIALAGRFFPEHWRRAGVGPNGPFTPKAKASSSVGT